MDRTIAIVAPILLGIAASLWLYGWPSPKQRREALPGRRRLIMAATIATALLTTAVFFTRTRWVWRWVSQEVGLSIFVGLILLLVALLYAALPPQKDL